MRLRVDRRIGLLLAGSVLLTFVAVGVTVVLPATDAATRTTSDSKRVYDARAAAGMRIYRNEGCWYCHTQQVREVATDSGLGAPLSPGDYAADHPAMLGSERGGTDLTHVGSRLSGDEIGKILRDPRSVSPHSSMPSYRYLSEKDIDALTAYLLALK